ncbi:ADP-ribosylation factor-related protein 1 isoform X1 [Hemicordylus capensis]|uniref:ADP-ribosylation factor-related protein 1 isoform X1 n=1 Tax=Hemicordylus capensis TaxID=884348 RepID=UPI0023031260|nr:ADP-ribosylation factor-related protein 1 isoform X1 [Hemicordylus capensis]XP_053169667.1 ADP-ribosylation factor-related protein 1 isoform X1 [Hemicordylus capensis]XP_053169668.1 ADP-ribosylation factor-related protein 1 isoform X1 [Hemicordylus capensis]
MYTLLSGLYKYMFRRDEYCILILGLDNAGKTTFLEQTKTRFNKSYKGMSLSKITTTVGLNIGTIDVGKARLMFWDLGGQEELQSLWDKYYAESHGVIYVIDSTDEERLSESKRAFEKMVTSEVLEGVPLLVLANKQDVETKAATSAIYFIKNVVADVPQVLHFLCWVLLFFGLLLCKWTCFTSRLSGLWIGCLVDGQRMLPKQGIL